MSGDLRAAQRHNTVGFRDIAAVKPWSSAFMARPVLTEEASEFSTLVHARKKTVERKP
jgi:hypothetical protein